MERTRQNAENIRTERGIFGILRKAPRAMSELGGLIKDLARVGSIPLESYSKADQERIRNGQAPLGYHNG